MIALSTLGRSEAILDLHAPQLKDGLIYFLDPDRAQTSKQRSTVPVAPSLAPWLDGAMGKVITYRVPLAQRRWSNPDVPEWYDRECSDIGKAFEACLVEAGISRQAVAKDRKPVFLPPPPGAGRDAATPADEGTGDAQHVAPHHNHGDASAGC